MLFGQALAKNLQRIAGWLLLQSRRHVVGPSCRMRPVILASGIAIIGQNQTS
jgi:hypothetical protein